MQNKAAEYIKEVVTDLAHIGVPTNDIEETIAFYESLGFTLVMRTINEAANEKVAFLSIQNVTIETYENHQAVGTPGSIDHIALTVTDIHQTYKVIKESGYTLLDDQVQFLPFWDNGVEFFTITGPNQEKIEFCQERK